MSILVITDRISDYTAPNVRGSVLPSEFQPVQLFSARSTIDDGAQSENQIDGVKDNALLPATIATTDRNTHYNSRYQYTSDLEMVELEIQFPVPEPTKQNERRSNEEYDLGR